MPADGHGICATVSADVLLFPASYSNMGMQIHLLVRGGVDGKNG